MKEEFVVTLIVLVTLVYLTYRGVRLFKMHDPELACGLLLLSAMLGTVSAIRGIFHDYGNGYLVTIGVATLAAWIIAISVIARLEITKWIFDAPPPPSDTYP